MTTSHKIDVLGLDFQRNGKKRASASEATSRASSVEPGSAAFAVGALHGALKLDWCFGDCEEVLLLAGSETTDSMIFYVWAFAHMCTYVHVCAYVSFGRRPSSPSVSSLLSRFLVVLKLLHKLRTRFHSLFLVSIQQSQSKTVLDLQRSCWAGTSGKVLAQSWIIDFDHLDDLEPKMIMKSANTSRSRSPCWKPASPDSAQHLHLHVCDQPPGLVAIPLIKEFQVFCHHWLHQSPSREGQQLQKF